MALKHVVVTSVDRDDVPDRGARHFAATIRAIKVKLPEASVEVLTPDFLGVEEEALDTVLAARPEVFNHNIETVRRLHRNMRGAKASYDKALWLLGRAKELADYPVLTKSGIIVGLGETNDEIVETMRDLRAHGVDVVTIGQYLQPSPKHAADRPLGAPGRVPLAAGAGRGARLRLRLRRPARPLELPRRRAAPRRRDRPRRRRLLAQPRHKLTPFRGVRSRSPCAFMRGGGERHARCSGSCSDAVCSPSPQRGRRRRAGRRCSSSRSPRSSSAASTSARASRCSSRTSALIRLDRWWGCEPSETVSSAPRSSVGSTAAPCSASAPPVCAAAGLCSRSSPPANEKRKGPPKRAPAVPPEQPQD